MEIGQVHNSNPLNESCIGRFEFSSNKCKQNHVNDDLNATGSRSSYLDADLATVVLMEDWMENLNDSLYVGIIPSSDNANVFPYDTAYWINRKETVKLQYDLISVQNYDFNNKAAVNKNKQS